MCSRGELKGGTSFGYRSLGSARVDVVLSLGRLRVDLFLRDYIA